MKSALKSLVSGVWGLGSGKGFTLLEIMVAVSILGISIMAIMDIFNTSMIRSGRGEDITTATMLARLKLHEVQLDLEKGMDKGEFPSDNKTMEGAFDEPYERYKWVADIKKVEIPVPPQPEGEDAQSMGMMLKVFQLISEKIGEAAREVKLTVIWDELGEEQSLSVATHIVKL